jgi:NAD(P)-dependent dehydrogenase (short-subunit alcohol dehydrogenase family)
MVESSVMTPRYTLVLGGSAGIGFAYAEWCAARKRRLIIVARRRSRLANARRELLAAGAKEVICRSGDLLEPRFRKKLLAGLADKHFSSVFIGGPSPPSFSVRMPVWQAARKASETCLVYPVHILDSFLRRRDRGVEVILLSSSATRERPEKHPFFWSATVRPMAEAVLKALAKEQRELEMAITVWRPKVVDTELARRYAISLPPRDEDDSLVNRLRHQFQVSLIPTPKEYICRMMRRRDG